MKKVEKVQKKETRGRKKSGRTEVLYVRLKPENREWLREQSEMYGSEAFFMDKLISELRGYEKK